MTSCYQQRTLLPEMLPRRRDVENIDIIGLINGACLTKGLFCSPSHGRLFSGFPNKHTVDTQQSLQEHQPTILQEHHRPPGKQSSQTKQQNKDQTQPTKQMPTKEYSLAFSIHMHQRTNQIKSPKKQKCQLNQPQS